MTFVYELVNASKELTVVLVDKKAKPGRSEVLVALIVVTRSYDGTGGQKDQARYQN